MLTVMEAIQRRRSIRKFKPDPVPDEVIDQILEAARLAPSAHNRQPWRFQIVKSPVLKEKIFTEATLDNKQVHEAPVIIVCGSELLTYVKGHSLSPPESDYFAADSEDWEEIRQFIPDAQLNTAIAVEHMVLAATTLGVGTCWVRRIRYGQLAKMLGWPRHIVVFALLLMGYPDEDPAPRPRLPRQDVVLLEGHLPQ